MTSKEKIKFVKNLIEERAAISPSGSLFIELNTIIDIDANGGIPDDAPILLSKKDQRLIMEKLEEEGYIKNLLFEDNSVWLELIQDKKKTSPIGNKKPYTEIKKGKGYFKFFKEGENIEIGGEDSRHFRLLQCMCDPYLGIQKTIESIFETIRLPKDKNDNDLLNYSPQRRTKIITLIEYTKKELQKNKKLQGKIKYKFDDKKNNMWLELEG